MGSLSEFQASMRGCEMSTTTTCTAIGKSGRGARGTGQRRPRAPRAAVHARTSMWGLQARGAGARQRGCASQRLPELGSSPVATAALAAARAAQRSAWEARPEPQRPQCAPCLIPRAQARARAGRRGRAPQHAGLYAKGAARRAPGPGVRARRGAGGAHAPLEGDHRHGRAADIAGLRGEAQRSCERTRRRGAARMCKHAG